MSDRFAEGCAFLAHRCQLADLALTCGLQNKDEELVSENQTLLVLARQREKPDGFSRVGFSIS